MIVTFTDKWGCQHTISVERAAAELKAFYDEWPGGLEEIEAAVRSGLRESPKVEPDPRNPFWCAGCTPDNCAGCTGVTRAT